MPDTLSFVTTSAFYTNGDWIGNFDKIPNGLSKIPQWAFDGIYAEDLIIPEDVKYIGNYAFAAVGNVTITDTNIELGYKPFGRINGNISAPEDFIYENISAFENSVWFEDNYGENWLDNQSDGIVYMGNTIYTYKGDKTTLRKLVIPEGITKIHENAFEGCTNLTEIQFPKSLTSIADKAFAGCTNLETIKLPNELKKIGADVFNGCTALKNIYMGTNIQKLGAGAFDNTAWYNNQNEGIVYISNVAYAFKGDKETLTNINIVNGTRTIADSAFKNCDNVKSIYIPDGILYIGNDAFRHCATEIVIPEGVTTINQSAFSASTNLTVPKSIISLGSDEFSYINEFGGMEHHSPILRMKCYKDSLAEKYAYAFNISYEIIPEPVDIPKSNVQTGEVEVGTRIALLSDTEGAEIYYTTDGSTPTTESSKYSGEIEIFESVIIKAIAVKEGMLNSDMATFEYTINYPEIETENGKLKQITVDYILTSKKMYFDISVEDYSGDAKVYVAIYDTEGEMLDITGKALVVNDITSLSLDKKANAEYAKVFVCGNGIKPITKAKIISEL